MKERLMNDLKEAMKEKDIIKKNTVQMIRAMILQKEKDEKKELSNEEIEKIIMNQKKQRTDALSQFEKANREDLINQTKREIEIIEQYLPKQLDYGEIETIVIGIIDRTGSKDFGTIMKQAKKEIGNSAEGRLISEVIKEVLSK